MPLTMRILIVSIYYAPEPVPKPHELAEGLARLGHSVTVLTAFPSYPEGKIYQGYRQRWRQVEQINGVRVVRLPVYADHSARAIKRVAHVLSFFFSVLLLGPWLSGPFDVAYVWGNPPTSGLAGWLLSRLRRAKFVYGVHDLWPELAEESGMIRGRRPLAMLGALERFVLGRADFVLPISEGFRRNVVEKGVPPSRVKVIPHWADEAAYHPVPSDEALIDRLGIRDCFVVAYAGNIGRFQGLVDLVEAASLLRHTLPQLRVLVIGNGLERDSLRALAARLEAHNVLFVDRMPPADVVRHSAVADALYVGLADTRLARVSVPSKLATYLACGRAVIANVPGETAVLVEEADIGINTGGPTAAAIAGAITRMAALTPAERHAMGQRGLALFRATFSMDTLLQQHEVILTSVVAGTVS
jgi:colanic acid biosynthesis glycosyl transferase WcaI